MNLLLKHRAKALAMVPAPPRGTSQVKVDLWVDHWCTVGFKLVLPMRDD